MLNVARYDVFKLGEAVLAGQTARVLRMLDGLRAEGEAPVLVHWTLAEDIRALKRVKDAVGARQAAADGHARSACLGREGAPVRARWCRCWPTTRWRTGSKRRSVCDGLVKGLKHPDWPLDAWDGLKRLALMVTQHTAAPKPAQPLRLALQASF